MNEQIYLDTLEEMASTNASLSMERAFFKARWAESQKENEYFKAVLASDSSLAELFNEQAAKLVENQQEEEDGSE